MPKKPKHYADDASTPVHPPSEQTAMAVLPRHAEDPLRSVAQALEDAQTLWEDVAFIANAKMPCPECGGAGNVSNGSLGGFCVRCDGARVVDHPSAEPLTMPPFAALRLRLSSGNPPTHEEIAALVTQAKAISRQLAPVSNPNLLPAAQPPQGLLGKGKAGLGGISDAELDDLER